MFKVCRDDMLMLCEVVELGGEKVEKLQSTKNSIHFKNLIFILLNDPIELLSSTKILLLHSQFVPIIEIPPIPWRISIRDYCD